MMKEHFERLIQYDYWATEKIIEALTNAINYDTKCISLITHIIEAQEIWLARLTNDTKQFSSAWPEYTLAESRVIHENNNQKMNSFVQSKTINDFNELIHYKNMKGENFSSSIKDILTHLVNHGTHHRAQIISLLKQSNNLYPTIDFIIFVRQ